MLNKVPQLAQDDLENLPARYFDLNDNVPVGYMMPTDKGSIPEINLIGAERNLLINRHFDRFITDCCKRTWQK
jgi:hypothetical protein